MKKFAFLFILLMSVFSFAQTTTTTVKRTTTKTTTKKGTTKAKPAKMPAGVSIWTVDAQRGKCEGATTMQCLLVKKPGDRDFNLLYELIEGFDYQEGAVYTIWVKQEPKTPPIPVGASIYKYTLVKIVSKKPIPGYSNTTSNTTEMKDEIKKPYSGLTESFTRTLVVNEQKAPCEGIAENKCLLIKKEGAKEFEIFYQDIEGFVFEEGYRQTILVRERHIPNGPPTKQAEAIYTLLEVISKVPIKIENPTTTTPVSTGTIEPKTALDKKWFLIKMKDSDTSSYEIDDKAVYVEFNSAESRFTGKAPCNTYFGGFKSDLISTFQASAVSSTKVYCNNIKLEDLYFSLFQNAERYEIKDGKLSLYKGDRLLLVFQ